MALDTSSIYGIGDGFNQSARTAAEVEAAKQRARLPFGGASIPGAAGQVVGLEMLKGLFGENSEQYRQAVRAFNLDQMSDESRIGYQDMLTKTAPQRALTPYGKTLFETSNVEAGNSPTGSPWSPEHPAPASQKDIAGGYKLLSIKNQSDPQARARALSATNIDKTLDMIDPDSLTQYAGVGQLGKKFQEGLAPFGKEDKSYDLYIKSKQAAKLLAKQVRQFYGESIQPEMAQKLEDLADPANWQNNPRLAKELFEEVEQILRNETATYREALRNPDVYNEQKSANASESQGMEGQIQSTKEVNGMKYAFFGGKWHEVE